jgi:hypothetical protein
MNTEMVNPLIGTIFGCGVTTQPKFTKVPDSVPPLGRRVNRAKRERAAGVVNRDGSRPDVRNLTGIIGDQDMQVVSPIAAAWLAVGVGQFVGQDLQEGLLIRSRQRR